VVGHVPAERGHPLQQFGGGLPVEGGRLEPVQPHAGQHAGIAIRRATDEESGAQIVRLFLQPVAVFVDDLALAAKAVIQRAPSALRIAVEFADQRILVERFRRRVEFGEQFVIRIHRPRRVPFRQPGGQTEVCPVAPTVVDPPAMNAGLALELKQRNFRSGFIDDAAKFGEEVGGGEHGGGPWSFVIGHWGRPKPRGRIPEVAIPAGRAVRCLPYGETLRGFSPSEPGRVGPDGSLGSGVIRKTPQRKRRPGRHAPAPTFRGNYAGNESSTNRCTIRWARLT